MYTHTNFKTKAELVRALAEGKQVRVFQPNGDLRGGSPQTEGLVYLEGPHYPQPHRWYAQAVISGGMIVSLDGKTVEKLQAAAAAKAAKGGDLAIYTDGDGVAYTRAAKGKAS